MGLPIKQPPFQNVGRGLTATIPRLDMGDTCDALLLKLSGDLNDSPTAFAVSHLEEIYIKLGGKTVVDGLTGDQLQTINKYMLRNVQVISDQFLLIQFADNMARTISGEDMGAIDTTLGYSSFSATVKIAGTGAGGNPGLECWMLKSAPKPEGQTKALFRAYTKSIENFNAAATFSLSPALGSMAGNVLNRLHVFDESKIDQFDVKKNGVEIQGDGEKAVIEYIAGSTRKPQTGHVCYDPAYSNNQSDAITTVRKNGAPANIEFRATLSAAATLTEVAELYTVINRI